MKEEALVIFTLILAGSVFLNALGMRGWHILPLGFLSGITIFNILFYLQLLTLNLHPLLPLMATPISAVTFWLWRKKKNKNIRLPFVKLLVGIFITVLLVILLTKANIAPYHSDSYRYLMMSIAFFDNNYEGIAALAVEDRLSMVPVLHSLAGFSDNSYLRSITPLISLSILMTLFWLIITGLRRLITVRLALVYAFIGTALLLTSNAYLFHSFYLNGHLMVAAFMLLAVGAGWLMNSISLTKKVSPELLVGLQSVGLVGLTFARVEGFLFASVALLPTILLGKAKIKYKKILVGVLGFAIILQQLVQIALINALHGEIPGHIIALLPGGAVLVALAVLLHSFKRWFTRKTLWASELALWLALGVLAIKDSEILIRSVKATITNIAFVPAYWGMSLVILIFIAIVALAFYKMPNRALLRYPVTAIVPILFLLIFLRDGGYRVNHADSLNRMLIQVVPELVLLIIILIAFGPKRDTAKAKK